ncbi:MAG: hypothetical protein ACJ8I9_07005 [Chthoniobacterales bacterium]
MKNVQRHVARFGAILLSACTSVQIASAQPATNQPLPGPKAAQVSHASETSKPQVVYHVPSRQTAEALHAQSKSMGDLSLPIESNTPSSAQLPRPNVVGEGPGARGVDPAATEVRGVQRGKRKGGERMAAPTRGGSQSFGAGRAHGGRGHGKRHGGD